VYATARDETKATELRNVAQKSGGRVQILSADAGDLNSLNSASQEIKQSSLSLDIVIYNAGVLNGFGNILEVGVDGLKDNINTNVYGAYYTATEFAPMLLKSKCAKKSLVLLSSEYGSIALSSKVFADHEKLFGVSGYDSTAMYNISKVIAFYFLLLREGELSIIDCSQPLRNGARSRASSPRSTCLVGPSRLG
jgi:NAD(P)-dependent dehydrogenase (short-subunit alcohol dehydrogenase family)